MRKADIGTKRWLKGGKGDNVKEKKDIQDEARFWRFLILVISWRREALISPKGLRPTAGWDAITVAIIVI